MAKSDTLENESLTYWLTTTVGMIRPVNWEIALYTADPNDDGSGTEVDITTEDTAYVRQAITFGAPSLGSIVNDSAATFVACVYGTNGVPYSVTHVAVHDALGTMLYHTELDTHKTISSGDQANFAIGDLTVTED